MRPGLSLLAGILVWEALGWTLGLPWIPPFSRVLAGLVELTLNGEILGNLATTLGTLAIGFFLSLVIGLPVGALMGRFKRVEQALGIYIYTGILVPSLAMAPIYFAIFGLSSMTRIMIVVQFAVFFLIVNTATAFRTVDSSLEEMGRGFGANRRQNLWQIVLPGSAVMLFAGIRIAVGRSIKGMISGEMFIAVVGLGGVIQKYGTQFDASKVLAVALITLVIAVALGAVARAVERRFTRWAE
jgi:NitT/TauT family transport system permease protein